MKFGKVKKKVTHEKYGEREITFLVPQTESVEELTQFYGSAAEHVSRNNKLIGRSAPQSSLLRLGKSSAATLEDFEKEIADEIEKTKQYKPETTGGMSRATKAENADKILALATEDKEQFLKMTPEQILAMLQGSAA
jgi:hypothetical protein